MLETSTRYLERKLKLKVNNEKSKTVPVAQWKTPKTRVQNLIKLGMEPWKAYRNGNTRKGYWAVAGSGILTHTITKERLAQAGYFDILDKYESLNSV